MNELEKENSYSKLLIDIGDLLSEGRNLAVQRINTVLIETYWNIGKSIVEFEQKGQRKAEYGSTLLTQLAKDLKLKYGKGFSKSNIYSMRLFYLKYKKFQTVSGKLGWSKYCELLAIDDELARSFYEKQCLKENWSVRELKRQIKASLFERVALSKDKKGVLKLAARGSSIEKPNDHFFHYCFRSVMRNAATQGLCSLLHTHQSHGVQRWDERYFEPPEKVIWEFEKKINRRIEPGC
ncbi:MAG: DUF1016 domain-containing protein [bacterium]|nr:DUF1016 domain-containing protein [bacterium]